MRDGGRAMNRPPTSGWFWIDNRAIDRLQEVGLSAFVVYSVLSRLAKDRRAYASAATIAELGRMTRRSVFRALGVLESRGWIAKTKAQGQPNGYTLSPLSAGDTPTPQDHGDTNDPGDTNDTGTRGACVTTSPGGRPRHETPKKRGGSAAVTPLGTGDTNDTRTRDKRKQEKEDPLSLESLVDQWNQVEGIQPVRKVTASRRKAFLARAKDPDWLADLPAALKRVGQSAFCTGQNDRGWKADIDWFLRPDSVTRILEGRYDDRPSNGNGAGRPSYWIPNYTTPRGDAAK